MVENKGSSKGKETEKLKFEDDFKGDINHDDFQFEEEPKNENTAKTNDLSHILSDEENRIRTVVNETIAKARKRRERKRLIKGVIKTVTVLIIASVIMIRSMAYMDMATANSMKELPVLKQIFKIATLGIYDYEDEQKTASIRVPEFRVDDSNNEENQDIIKINNEIKQIAKSQIKEFKKEIAKKKIGYLESVLSYDIIEVTDKYFTLKVKTYMAMADGQEKNYYYTIDRESNKQLTLKEIIKGNTEILDEISENILIQMKEQMAMDVSRRFWISKKNAVDELGDGKVFNEISFDRKFYVDKWGKIHIVFDQGEVGPYSLGEVDFAINKKIISY